MGADTREPREKYFIKIAHMVATRATCPRASVGCVITHKNRIVSTGYNGSAKNAEHCIEVGCLMDHGSCRRTIHAEMNALVNMAGGPYPTDLVMYCTHKPCYQCAKAIATANIRLVFYDQDYKDPVRDKLNLDIGFFKVDIGNSI